MRNENWHLTIEVVSGDLYGMVNISVCTMVLYNATYRIDIQCNNVNQMLRIIFTMSRTEGYFFQWVGRGEVGECWLVFKNTNRFLHNRKTAGKNFLQGET